MKRQIALAIFLLLLLTTSAWPKFKEDEQKFLDDQFKALQEQMQAIGNQTAALNSQLAEIKQTQAQLQTVMIRQQRQLQELDQMLSSLRIGNEENFAKLSKAVADLRAETATAVSKLTGQPMQPSGPPADVATVSRPAAPAGRQSTQGYITAVEGSNVMIDMGSAQGVHPGSQLAVYKATDPNSRVGVIEITQVVDAGNARARIITMNAGVKPEFSDVVRAE
jgi:hypothetical protein